MTGNTSGTSCSVKSGHSNAVEASHNVLIRCGVSYHWIPELFHHMGLPLDQGLNTYCLRGNRHFPDVSSK